MAEIEYTLEDILEVQARGVPKGPGRKVCVTGGRDFRDKHFVWDNLDNEHARDPINYLGVGCATGVDAYALNWALNNKIPLLRYVADWDRWGTAGGSIRNIVMLEDFQPDELLVFPGGVGTTHCTRAARKRSIERIFFNDDDDDPFAAAKRWG